MKAWLKDRAALVAENERLRTALKWYAEHPCPCWPWEDQGNGVKVSRGCDWGQRAAQALSGTPKEKSQ